MLSVLPLDDDHVAVWDRFVADAPGSAFFHRAAWREVLTDGVGLECLHLLAKRENDVVGVLPLALVRGLWFGRSLVSLPFCVEAGVLAADEEVRQALLAAAVEIGESRRVRRVELRSGTHQRDDWQCVEHYATFRRQLSTDHETNLKAIPRKQRAVVRQSQEVGLSAVVTDDLDRFFRIYATSVRNLGSPVCSKRYLAALEKSFGADVELCLVQHGGKDVAGVLSFYDRGRVLPYYGGALPEARALKAYDFLYWDLMCRAVDRGCTEFDFGRSIRGTGSFAFKKNWGFAPTPLYYEFDLLRGSELPERNPNDRTNRLLMNMWRRLPLFVANRLGPPLARHFT